VELALGEHGRLATEAADALEPADDARVDARDDALELFRGRSVREEFRHDAIDRLAADLGRLAGVQHDREVEHARELERRDADVDLRRDLFLVDEIDVEARVAALAEHRGGEIEEGTVTSRARRHDPRAVHEHRGDFVVLDLARVRKPFWYPG